MSWSTEKLKEVLTLSNIFKTIGWFLILGISIYALNQSNKSINIANESNNIARRALTSGQRPYLSVKPIKFDNGKFIFIKAAEKGIEQKFRFEISNKGNSTAQNIILTPIVVSAAELFPANPKIVIVNNYEVFKWFWRNRVSAWRINLFGSRRIYTSYRQ